MTLIIILWFLPQGYSDINLGCLLAGNMRIFKVSFADAVSFQGFFMPSDVLPT